MRARSVTLLALPCVAIACGFDPARTIELSSPPGDVTPRDRDAGVDLADASQPDATDGGSVDGSAARDGGDLAGPNIDAGTAPPFQSNYDPADVTVGDAIRIDCEASIDTDALTVGAWCGAPPSLALVPGTDLALLAATRFEVTPTGRLDVRGTRPLVVVVAGNALIDGVVTAAHANRACAGTDGRDDGGGGGGGFGAAGAEGGDGGDGGGGRAGDAIDLPGLVPLEVGCRGGDGDGSGGRGGRAGGALEISAGGAILVRGSIEAFGEGGRGGGRRGGGGGGGAGGAILLEGDVVTVQGGVYAHGGGGGQAGDDDGGGEDGEDGAPANTAASGGRSADGAPGGDGATGELAATAGADGRSGAGGSGGDRPGGGGGGGPGRIHVNANRCALSPTSPASSRGGGC